MINKFLPLTCIWKLLIISGSGEAGEEQKGDNTVEVLTAPAAAVPLDAEGKRGSTNTERILGMPFVTKILKGLFLTAQAVFKISITLL